VAFSPVSRTAPSAYSAFRPIRPNRPFFLLPHRSKEPSPPPSSAAPASFAMGALPRAPHCIPRTLSLLTTSFREVKRQLRGSHFIPINTGHYFALTTGCHPPPLSAPIKGESPTVLHCTSSRSLSLLPTPKHRSHRAPTPLLLHRRRSVSTPTPMPW
jgi:hypothetical protein